MSEVAPARAEPRAAVRRAAPADAAAVAAAVERLLVELGGARPARQELEAAARRLSEDPDAGALLVAEAEGEIVGVLAASWQHALHVPGTYGTIQDLWVDPAWRSRAIGRELVAALTELALERGVTRLEVGLPQDDFVAIDATRAFYLSNAFSPLGARMRRLLR